MQYIMKLIFLSQGLSAMVDDKDFEALNQHKWSAAKLGNTFYAVRIIKKKPIYMHREILNTPDGMETDHRDRNGINNQRDNLKSVTRQQNHFNRNAKGYYFHKDAQKFQAQIVLNGKRKYLGYFKTEAEAHEAYLEAKKIYHI